MTGIIQVMNNTNHRDTGKPRWAVGLMTGTVLDGNIDVALVKTDGQRIIEFGPYVLSPYPAHVIELLEETLQAALKWQFTGPEPSLFKQAEHALTQAQTLAVQQLLDTHNFKPEDIAAVGFHGQTVLHRPPLPGQPGNTRQLGDGQTMATQLGIPVVYDFRSADMAAGGQGAPLAAVYHQALLNSLDNHQSGDTAVLNLGGVANITWCDNDTLLAFDTGPANAPINDWVARHGLGRMDKDGAIAAAGIVDEARLTQLLTHPYLHKPAPKSLDRFDFKADMAAGLSVQDGAALLCAFVGSAIGCALDLLPSRPARLLVSGGGRHNPVLLANIEQRAGVQIQLAEAVNWRGDALESECFAFLAVRALSGLPLSFPSTTGANKPVCGGLIATP